MPHYSDTVLHMPLHQQPTHNKKGYAVPLYLKTGTVYRFAKKGDKVDWHEHTAEGSDHLVIVTRGALRYKTSDGDNLLLDAGSHFHVPLNVKHILIAEADDSECSNVQSRVLDKLPPPPPRTKLPWYKRVFR